MISILPIETGKFRTFGWVQDPSNFRSLCNVVAVFDNRAPKHKELTETILPRLVLESDGRDELIAAMKSKPLKIKYAHLVGTSFTPRSTSRCNGIVQAAVKGQGRDFIGDWPADNFVRWAHCLGFIAYDYSDDTFSITKSGLELTKAYTDNGEISASERDILVTAMLSYAPAVRVLALLNGEGKHLTKFEIGRQLGFVGEGGFGSMPQGILIRSLAGISNSREKNDMRNNWEGASDKYARMIASWLAKLGLVQKVSKDVTVTVGGTDYTETIGQSYMITAQGVTALNRALGKSRHARIGKNICFEMLATKGSDREYLRTRRALIIKALSESKSKLEIDVIIDSLSAHKIQASHEIINDDIQGLCNIGLDIVADDGGFLWNDVICDFVIPVPTEITQSTVEQTKDTLRESINHISHDYLLLLDIAYDSTQNRLFEMKTLELLTEECGYMGTHLGGSRKPDGVVYTNTLSDNYGVIIDTKAYSGGYNLPISQADEMQRYVQENQRRDERENPNKWWDNFGEDVRRFYFLFVSGHFIGRYQEQIDRISHITQTRGAAVEISNLLLFADKVKGDSYSLDYAESAIFHA
ncbi:hypothetical protein FACS1894202_02600 [Clostridia bacterium]|nr:hypothetical protein FACS1894202_02600 [Clostridia bacterium]